MTELFTRQDGDIWYSCMPKERWKKRTYGFVYDYWYSKTNTFTWIIKIDGQYVWKILACYNWRAATLANQTSAQVESRLQSLQLLIHKHNLLFSKHRISAINLHINHFSSLLSNFLFKIQIYFQIKIFKNSRFMIFFSSSKFFHGRYFYRGNGKHKPQKDG